MAPAELDVRCRCGTGLSTTEGGAKYCENCDTAQPQERMGFERRKTREDVRFDMYWIKEESLYKNNAKPWNPKRGESSDD